MTTVLVTGANGFIGSHIVRELLEHGFCVRAAVRSKTKSKWMLDYFGTRYGPERIELVEIPDMSQPGAYIDPVRGSFAFIHTASYLSFGCDAERIISQSIDGVRNALIAAQTEPRMKHFIYTSSTSVAWATILDKEETKTENSWNDNSIQLAHCTSPMQGVHVYEASKTQAEKYLWRFAELEKPVFTVYAVVSAFNLGPILEPREQQRNSAGLIAALFLKGLEAVPFSTPSQHFVDVRDCARLHIDPLLDKSIDQGCLFAISGAFTLNEVIDIFLVLRPNHNHNEKTENTGKVLFQYNLKCNRSRFGGRY